MSVKVADVLPQGEPGDADAGAMSADDIATGLVEARRAMGAGKAEGAPPEGAVAPRMDEEEKEKAGVTPKAAPAPDVPDPPKPPEPAPAPDPAAPRVSDEVLRLSKLQRQMDSEYKQKADALEKERASIAEQKASMEAMEKRLQLALEDPHSFYKDAGYDPVQAAKLIAAQAGIIKGDNAPSDIRLQMTQMKDRSEAKTEIEKLRQELEEMKKAHAERDQQAELQKWIGERKQEYTQWLTDVPESLHHVRRASAARPEWVADQMLRVLETWADRNPGNHERLPRPEDLAEWLNNSLEEEYGFLLTSAPATPAATPEPPAAKPQSATADPLPTDELQARTGSDAWPDDSEDQQDRIVAELRRRRAAR